MNTYPPELKSPPLPVVAFIGQQEVHKEVGSYFSQVLRPPLLSIGAAEATEQLLARVFGAWGSASPRERERGMLEWKGGRELPEDQIQIFFDPPG